MAKRVPASMRTRQSLRCDRGTAVVAGGTRGASGSRLLAGLVSLWPTISTVIADAGHTSRKLAGQLRRDAGNCESSSAGSVVSRSLG
jgi:hypothetical protein